MGKVRGPDTQSVVASWAEEVVFNWESQQEVYYSEGTWNISFSIDCN